MNADIIYEIIKYLYICPEENGGVLLSRKILFSQKSFQYLESKVNNLQKPVVFSLRDNYFNFSKIGQNIYWSDETLAGNLIQYTNIVGNLYIIKLFSQIDRLSLPDNIEDVYSIGNVKNLSWLFFDSISFNKNIGKKWDTSNVTDMSHMFFNCIDFNKNVGKNWNTSNVVDMSYMFDGCVNLDKNIGINWTICSDTNVHNMIYRCAKF